MIVTNIHFRIIFGVHTLFIGIMLLKIYHSRNKDNLFGHIYRLGKETFGKRNAERYTDKVYLILGWLSIIGGLIALLYGFRMKMVGY